MPGVKLTAIVPPKDIIKKLGLVDAILAEQKKTGEGIRNDYRKTVATWETRVAFSVDFDAVKGTVEVSTKSKVFTYVDQGTKPHVILPKKKKALRFLSNYSPKTTPGFLGSTAGGSSGSTVFSKVVHHPGVKARLFSKKIAIKWAYTYESRMMAAIKAALRGQ